MARQQLQFLTLKGAKHTRIVLKRTHPGDREWEKGRGQIPLLKEQ